MTTTKDLTIQEALNEANPSRAWSAVQKAKLGDALRGVTKTLTGLTAASAFDLTTITDPDDSTKKLPAALVIQSLRVTAGSAQAGLRQIGDAGATPTTAIATVSADGKTITLEDTATAFIISYVPKEDLTVKLENAS